MEKHRWGELKRMVFAIPKGGHTFIRSRKEAYSYVTTAMKHGLDLAVRNLSGGLPYEERWYLLVRGKKDDLERIISTAASGLVESRPPMNPAARQYLSEIGRRGGSVTGKTKRRSKAFYKRISQLAHESLRRKRLANG